MKSTVLIYMRPNHVISIRKHDLALCYGLPKHILQIALFFKVCFFMFDYKQNSWPSLRCFHGIRS